MYTKAVCFKLLKPLENLYKEVGDLKHAKKEH